MVQVSLEPDDFRNEVLAHLPASELELLSNNLSHVTLERDELLCKARDQIERIYFVERGVVSASVMDDDKRVQIGLVGRDGFAGCATVYSPQALSYWQIEVLIRGDAWMIPASVFHECLDKAPILRKRAVEQAQIFIGQVAQTSLCNNQHRLTQRLARWLLVTRDKARTDDLPLSGELIASALGPSRMGVQMSLRDLEEKALVRSSRLRTQILDPYGLEQAACHCYAHLRAFTEKVEASGGAQKT